MGGPSGSGSTIDFTGMPARGSPSSGRVMSRGADGRAGEIFSGAAAAPNRGDLLDPRRNSPRKRWAFRSTCPPERATSEIARPHWRLHRTALFVPRNLPDRVPKTLRFGADRLILDREDSAPVTERARGRALAWESIEALAVRVPELVRLGAIWRSALRTEHAVGAANRFHGPRCPGCASAVQPRESVRSQRRRAIPLQGSAEDPPRWSPELASRPPRDSRSRHRGYRPPSRRAQSCGRPRRTFRPS